MVVAAGSILLVCIVVLSFLSTLGIAANFGVSGIVGVLVASASTVPALLFLGVLLAMWGIYSFRRGATGLKVGTTGLTISDASGRELFISYDDPCIDTIPWFVPRIPRGRSWVSTPGGGAMVWIPPEAVVAIELRRRSGFPRSPG